MPIRDGKTVPYETKKQVQQGAKVLEDNFDPAVALAYRIGGLTGLRISDVLHLSYKNNIDYDKNKIYLFESKGTKAAQARQRIKALSEIKGMLLNISNDDVFKAEVYLTPVKNIYALVPIRFLPIVDKKIAEFVAEAKPKYREIVVPKKMMNKIKARQNKFDGLDDGLIFSRKTLKGNRAKNMDGVISREYMWRCFAMIGEILKLSFNTSCHQLRKSFAVFLYKDTGNNMAMVIETVGWSSDKILMNYLSITQMQIEVAVSKFQERYV